jgi:hypothetical protein
VGDEVVACRFTYDRVCDGAVSDALIRHLSGAV